MTASDFYRIIRKDKDPESFKQVQGESEAPLDLGAAYWLHQFKAQGHKDFFLSWNWCALFAPTIYAFYHGFYLFWFLKWVSVFCICIVSMPIDSDSTYLLLGGYLLIQRVTFALLANCLYIRKIKLLVHRYRNVRYTPSVGRGVVGCFMPSIF